MVDMLVGTFVISFFGHSVFPYKKCLGQVCARGSHDPRVFRRCRRL